jgi:hypothetical protein
MHYTMQYKNFLQEKAVEATKEKEEKRKKPKPEEHEGMPPRQHCPPKKRRGGHCSHHAIRHDMIQQLTYWVGSKCTDRGGLNTGIG